MSASSKALLGGIGGGSLFDDESVVVASGRDGETGREVFNEWLSHMSAAAFASGKRSDWLSSAYAKSHLHSTSGGLR